MRSLICLREWMVVRVEEREILRFAPDDKLAQDDKPTWDENFIQDGKLAWDGMEFL